MKSRKLKYALMALIALAIVGGDVISMIAS